MTHTEIRDRFRSFMESRGHTWVSSSSLLPDDPSVLFTTAGMQQFKPYYTGDADAQADYGALSTGSIQKCVRTSDIDEVGDESHLTFFEMLGNFSFGGYFKEEAIRLGYEFITRELGLTIDFVTVFSGDGDIPKDETSERVWRELDPDIAIRYEGRDELFWGPTGDEGPCGPTTEIHVQGLEIWNIVFNEYYCEKDGTFRPLETPGIDTGMGMERLAKVVQDVPTVFDTDLFAPIMALLPEQVPLRTRRIVADHARAVAFMLADGVRPSNKEQGYVLRRLMRRAIVHEQLNEEPAPFELLQVLRAVVDAYHGVYPDLDVALITNEFQRERTKFRKSLNRGLKEMEKLPVIDAAAAFKLYESYGLPYEIIKELGEERADGLTRDAFDGKYREHQDRSRAGAGAKFGGHGLLLDTGELRAGTDAEVAKVTRLHTATHLLNAALREVLGDDVRQAGSDITPERTRFDFTFPRKVTEEELTAVEGKVNDAIERDLPVTKVTLPKEEAERTGALHFFKMKYPAEVDVYTIGDPDGGWYSKEFCGGPHVSRTGEIGTFRILKEESVGAGARRIRATVG
jgi:alanyl-tRNA synthetase